MARKEQKVKVKVKKEREGTNGEWPVSDGPRPADQCYALACLGRNRPIRGQRARLSLPDGDHGSYCPCGKKVRGNTSREGRRGEKRRGEGSNTAYAKQRVQRVQRRYIGEIEYKIESNRQHIVGANP